MYLRWVLWFWRQHFSGPRRSWGWRWRVRGGNWAAGSTGWGRRAPKTQSHAAAPCLRLKCAPLRLRCVQRARRRHSQQTDDGRSGQGKLRSRRSRYKLNSTRWLAGFARCWMGSPLKERVLPPRLSAHYCYLLNMEHCYSHNRYHKYISSS